MFNSIFFTKSFFRHGQKRPYSLIQKFSNRHNPPGLLFSSRCQDCFPSVIIPVLFDVLSYGTGIAWPVPREGILGYQEWGIPDSGFRIPVVIRSNAECWRPTGQGERSGSPGPGISPAACGRSSPAQAAPHYYLKFHQFMVLKC